jgi:hypothetical protein
MTLKESILSDIDDTLQAGDNYAKDIEDKFKKFSNELVNTKNYDTRYMVSHNKGNKFGVDREGGLYCRAKHVVSRLIFLRWVFIIKTRF